MLGEYGNWFNPYAVSHLSGPHAEIPGILEDKMAVQSETDAQALGYKLGMLKILELRQRAQQQLGEKFDIWTFHDRILEEGALPLNLMEAKIDAWIAQQL